MSQDMIRLDNLPEALKGLLEKSFAKDLDCMGIKTLRLPRIKIGHGNQTFSLPDNAVSKTLTGWVTDRARVMEYYEKKEGQDEETSAPICAAINSYYGNKFGECAACEHSQWKDNPKNPNRQYRECASSYRVLITMQGASQPFELKIPQTSHVVFRKAVAEAMTSYALPLALMNLTVSLSPKKEGNQEWSLMEFKFVPMDMGESFIKKAEARLLFQQKYAGYFEKAYGGLTVHKTSDTNDADAADAADAADSADSADAETIEPSKTKVVLKGKSVRVKADNSAVPETKITTTAVDPNDIPF